MNELRVTFKNIGNRIEAEIFAITIAFTDRKELSRLNQRLTLFDMIKNFFKIDYLWSFVHASQLRKNGHDIRKLFVEEVVS